MKRFVLGVTLFLCGLSLTPAYANTVEQIRPLTYKQFYFSLRGGVLLPQTNYSLRGNVVYHSFPSKGMVRYKAGSILGATLGFQPNAFFATEINLNYAYFSATQGKTYTQDIHAISGFTNLIFTPFRDTGFDILGIKISFNPYVGGGPGLWMQDKLKWKSFTDKIYDEPEGDSLKTYLALDAFTGVEMFVSESFSFGVEYRFIFTESSAKEVWERTSDLGHYKEILNIGNTYYHSFVLQASFHI